MSCVMYQNTDLWKDIVLLVGNVKTKLLERNGMYKIVLTVSLLACEIAAIGFSLWLIKNEL